MRELGWTPDATVVERLRDVTAGHYRMSVGYNPQVNDYVVWTTELGQVHKGWVYFVGSKSEQKKGWQTLQDISLSRLLLNLA